MQVPLLVKPATYYSGVAYSFYIQGPVSDYTQESPEELANQHLLEMKILRPT